MSLYLFHGDEKYLMLNKKKAFIASCENELNIASFETFDKEAFDKCNAVPFFSSKRYVVVDGPFKGVMTSHLESYLSNPSDQTDLLLVISDKVDKRSRIFKSIDKSCIHEFKKLSKIKLSSFVSQKLSSISVNEDLSSFILEQLDYESDDVTLFDVVNQLNLLTSYDGVLTKELVSKFLHKKEKAASFELIEALLKKDNKRALELITCENRDKTQLRTLSLFKSNTSLMLRISLGADHSELEISKWRYSKVKASAKEFNTQAILALLEKAIKVHDEFLKGTIKLEYLLLALV